MKYDLYINGDLADTEDFTTTDPEVIIECFMLIGWADVISSEDKLEVLAHVEPVVTVEKRTSTLRNLFTRSYLFGQAVVFSVQTMFR